MRCRFCMGMFEETSPWEEVCSDLCARKWWKDVRHDRPGFDEWVEAHRRMIRPGGKMAVQPQCGCQSRITVRPWSDTDRMIAARSEGRGFGGDDLHMDTTLPSETGRAALGFFEDDFLGPVFRGIVRKGYPRRYGL